VLVNEDNGNIFPISCEPVECLFDGGSLGLGIDYEEVPLRVWWLRDMLNVYMIRAGTEQECLMTTYTNSRE